MSQIPYIAHQNYVNRLVMSGLQKKKMLSVNPLPSPPTKRHPELPYMAHANRLRGRHFVGIGRGVGFLRKSLFQSLAEVHTRNVGTLVVCDIILKASGLSSFQ